MRPTMRIGRTRIPGPAVPALCALALLALSSAPPAMAACPDPVAAGTTMRYRAHSVAPTDESVLVQIDTTMKYLANSSDPGIGLAWVAEAFDDTVWATGTYGVGYETLPPGALGLLRTTVLPAPGTFSVYTRARFTIADVTQVGGLTFGADYDDGYVVWINGVEVGRSATMPPGSPSWDSDAGLHESSNSTVPNYGALIDLTAAIPLLHDGENVLAVGVWNSAAVTSSDLVLVPRLATTSEWTAPDYDDTAWSAGTYGVGYETGPPPNAVALLATTVPAGTYSVFTRTTFTVDDPAVISGMQVGADYDDGYVAFLNGVEVARSASMPAGPAGWDSNAALHESSNGATPTYEMIDISAQVGLLTTGTNVLAVGVWNSLAATSTDLVLVPRLALQTLDLCNNLDDDCDGTTDEDFTPIATACGIGECLATGATACVAGVVTDTCTPGAPVPEACDNLDNDCDGVIDGFVTSCGTGACASTGLCTAGVDSCVPGGPGGSGCSAEHYLVAKAFTKTMPDGSSILMWGFARDADDDLTTDGGEMPTVPGPSLAVPPGGTTLTIHLRNDLDEPVSLVIPGTAAPLDPVWVDSTGAVVSTGSRRAGNYTDRVRSFTTETPAGGIGRYDWSGLSPGTFLYQSGTHAAVQVQMGLYGGLRVDAAPGLAYAGVPYTNEAVLLYSEIDPALHQAVEDGTYGTPAYPSTIHYMPKWFLVNGEPWPDAVPVLLHGIVTNESLLLRFLNAGLSSRAPLLQGAHLSLVAEDARPYPHPRDQYALLLPAGKTLDAIWIPAAPGTYPLYDRRLGLTNNSASPGGMQVHLAVSNPPGAPLAGPDAYSVGEDGSLVVVAPGVLGNDVDPESQPLAATLTGDVSGGVLALSADGSFTYTPNPNFNGTDLFRYKAGDGALLSNEATVVISVLPANDPPVAQPDGYSTDEGRVLIVDAPGVLANDSDIDGDTLTAVLVAGTANGMLTLDPEGGFTYTPAPGFAGVDGFTYQAGDGTTGSAVVAVTITVVAVPNVPPMAVDDAAGTRRNRPVVIYVIGNDTDVDGTIDPATVVIRTTPRSGTAVSNGDGTITYTPRRNFRGSDSFTYTVGDNEGATSNEATVRVNVTR